MSTPETVVAATSDDVKVLRGHAEDIQVMRDTGRWAGEEIAGGQIMPARRPRAGFAVGVGGCLEEFCRGAREDVDAIIDAEGSGDDVIG